MKLIEGAYVASASDLVRASTCEYAVLRRLDVVRGIGAPLPDTADALMDRAGALGIKHEKRLLDAMAGAVEIEDRHDVRATVEATLSAIAARAAVITQGVFFDGRMLGIADFLILQEDGSYMVADAKLARREKPTAVLQIAIYAELATSAGVAVSPTGALLLGNDEEFRIELDRIRPVVRDRRKRLEDVMGTHMSTGMPVDWNDPQITVCGRCDICAAQVEATHDVLLVAGLRMTQRAKLRSAGIETIEQLAASEDSVKDMADRTRAALKAQAVLQVQQLQAPAAAEGPTQVTYDVFNPMGLDAIPSRDSGDIFFDFEGDPLWQDPVTREWGLEYLFGVVEAPVEDSPPVFRPFWAHDRQQERQALKDFLQYVADRRRAHPNMHIYHYADYERAALLRLAGRHGIGEDQVDDLLRENVLVDLYPIVRRSLRVSQPSYSLKKLEPLYMGDRLREGEVTTAGDSVVEYAHYCDERDTGEDDAAALRLKAIADYNEYDCLSTLALRDWLLDRAAEAGIAPAAIPPQEAGPTTSTAAEAEELIEPLLAYATPAPGEQRTPEQTAVALVAASVGYHRREAKPYWWQHFERLEAAIDEIKDRDAMIIEEVSIDRNWNKPPKAQKPQRTLTVRGILPPGTSIKKDAYLLYEAPHPDRMKEAKPGTRGYTPANVGEASVDPDGYDRLVVTERTENGAEHDHEPTVITAGAGPRPGTVQSALEEIATEVSRRIRQGSADLIPGPARDLLLRRPPKLAAGTAGLPEVVGRDFIAAITAAVRLLDGSALAVQGPPGTGKTHVGGHVIAALVAEGWRIGVVSQGHSAVNHLLDGVVKAGVDPALVGKKDKPDSSVWTALKPTEYARFLNKDPGVGRVVGGTAWDFTCADRVGRGALDLLVVDEAGQYSLANTLAVSVGAQRMLLLGDPQQLPQVSQGTHPEPVDMSALGWLSGEHTLPKELGYFLDASWRMHPKVAEAVSVLSYDGRLKSQKDVTEARRMIDASGLPVDAGVFWRPENHLGHDVESPEEAAVVASLVQEALTWKWRDPRCDPAARPMTVNDILVVTPFNGQRALVDQELAKAGITGVRVGTVDKFQGQEAPLTIVSMTASSPADVPRGMGFLLSPNRLNVAVSRAQWRSVIVSSPALASYLPSSVEGLAELGGYLRLLGL